MPKHESSQNLIMLALFLVIAAFLIIKLFVF